MGDELVRGGTRARQLPLDSRPMAEPLQDRRAVVAGIAAAAAAVHLAPNAAYGLFRDELYYLACAKRLAWGYVDHPPLSIAVLALDRSVFGDSLLALRWIPALCAALVVLLAARMARRLGGDGAAATLAAAAAALAPIFVALFDFYSMNALEILAWTAASALLLEILGGGDERLWLAFGLLLGAGLLNKHTIVVFGAAVAVGILATRSRTALFRPWIWIAAGLSLLVVAPNLLWQQANGWPSLEFYRNAVVEKNVDTAPLVSVAQQAFASNFGALPVTIAGLIFLLAAPAGRPWRALGVAASVLLVAQVVSRSSRPDRVVGIYPLLFAAGAVLLERLSRTRRWILPAAATGVVAVGVAFLPIGTSLLPPPMTARGASLLGRLLQIERGTTARLPQWLADRSDWDAIAAQVLAVADRLPPEERDRAAIYAQNYGEAGAIERAEERRSGPVVVSNHNAWYGWSRGHLDGPVLIALGADPDELGRLYEQVEEVGRTSCTWCIDYENGVPIFLARGPKAPLSEFWEGIRHYQ